MQTSYLEQLDIDLFFFINGCNTPFLDIFFEFISWPYAWIPMYLILIYLFYKNYPLQVFLFILIGFILLILLSDKGSVLIFKNTVARYRPCHNTEYGHLVHIVNNKCGGLYGFVSSHASNFFAMATLVSLLLKAYYKYITAIVFSAAVVVSYSRVYLGVHYPLDVLVGGIYGILSACIIFIPLKKLILTKNKA